VNNRILKKIVKLLWLAFFLFLIIFIVSRIIKIIPSYANSTLYRHSLAEGVDFKRSGFPTFIDSIVGFSGEEPWGRWTDATKSPSAKIKFRVSLPRSFTLVLNAQAFGPNANVPVTIRITTSDPLAKSVEQEIFLKTTTSDHRLDFSIRAIPNADTIEIIPPHPTAPHTLNSASDDFRLVGVGVSSIKIINNPNIKNAQ